MGLDCSHGAFNGAYSSFNRLRQAVAAATGGSFPPHYVYDSFGELVFDEHGRVRMRTEEDGLDPGFWYFGDGYGTETHPGLTAFLGHSDCDGSIDPDLCRVVADELEALLPLVAGLSWPEFGHTVRGGGYVAQLRRFIAGCRAAAAAGEPLLFY